MTATASPAPSAQAARGVKLVRVGSFSSPLYVTAPPGDTHRVFVVEQGGRIRVVRDGRKLAAPFLDVSADITSGGEQGLLSMAFAPDYASSGRFYVYFTDTDGNERVQEFRRSASDPDRADPGTRRQILLQADSESNHNGGQMQFGPDGLLYIGMGDGGGAGDMHGARGNGQNLGTWLGKILRIDPHASGGRAYSVPPSNPFVGRAGALPEIYSYGLRNPWRFSFDRSTGDIAIGDVGQGSYEEVDFRRRGGARGVNFGWRVFEGRHRFASGSAPGAVRPVLEQTHSSGWCSITGGYVVRDRSLPALRGRYVYGDYCKGRLYSARLRSGGASRPRAVGVRKVEGLSSFGEDARGRVYVTSLSGPVYRLASK
jgi:glucose/arabinose dehydrogenase